MTQRTCVYLCNALDERTRDRRGILIDSPAATKKVLGIAGALRTTGVRVVVLSLGRGPQNGSGARYGAKAARVEKNAVVYAPFVHFPWLAHLIGLVGLVPLVWRLRPRGGAHVSLLVYNRLPHYVLAVLLAWVVGYRRFLDLEDGELPPGFGRRMVHALMRRFYDVACGDGALVANTALEEQLRIRPVYPCPGVAAPVNHLRDWNDQAGLAVLLGGTLEYSRGATLFVDAVRLLRTRPDAAATHLRFVVTGQGAAAKAIKKVAAEVGAPLVTFAGKVSRAAYVELLATVHAGLVLNLPSGELAQNTFPSKVVEFAEHGLLVVSTRVSDVPDVLGEDGALWLESAEAQVLADRLRWVAENREASARIAARGQQQVAADLAPEQLGAELADFLFGHLAVAQ